MNWYMISLYINSKAPISGTESSLELSAFSAGRTDRPVSSSTL